MMRREATLEEHAKRIWYVPIDFIAHHVLHPLRFALQPGDWGVCRS